MNSTVRAWWPYDSVILLQLYLQPSFVEHPIHTQNECHNGYSQELWALVSLVIAYEETQ